MFITIAIITGLVALCMYGVNGFQEFWIAGSRFYFKRDDLEAVSYPIIDLGRITPASPQISPNEAILKDSDGGVLKEVDRALTEFNETYPITCSNMNMNNLALLFGSTVPEAFAQAATEIGPLTRDAFVGHLLKMDDASGLNVYNLTRVNVFLASATPLVLVSTTNGIAGAAKITIDTDITATVAPGDKFLIYGNGVAGISNKIYTHVSEAVAGGDTEITVAEAITGSSGGGFAIKSPLIEGTDWEVVSLERGLIRFIPGGAITVDGTDVKVVITPEAISSSLRLVYPQSGLGTVKGNGILVWGRENNAKQTFREFACSITPSNANIQDTDFSSFVLNVNVLNDLTQAHPAGRLLYPSGDLPDEIS